MIKGIELSVLFGPGVPVPAPRMVIEALQSVSIQENAGETPSGFDMVFALEKNSPLNTIFLLAGGAALPILRVAFVTTINGQATTLINGVVTRTEYSPGSGGAPATLKVMGRDLTAAMEILDFSGLPYVAMPPFARVALILAKYAWLGVIPQVIPSAEGPPLPTEKIPRHQDTDLAYIRQLASEAGYTFFMKPGPAPATSFAYWGPEIRIGEVQPALTIEFGICHQCRGAELHLRQGWDRDPHRLHPEPAHQGPDTYPDPRRDPVPSAARRDTAPAAEDRTAHQHGAAQPVRGRGARLRPCRPAFGRREGQRPDRRAPLRPHPQGAWSGGRARRGKRL